MRNQPKKGQGTNIMNGEKAAIFILYRIFSSSFKNENNED